MTAPTATERIRQAGLVCWALVGIALVVSLMAWMAAAVAVIFPPLILAGAIVFILNPVVTFLAGRVPRVVGVALTYAALALVLTGLGFLLTPTVRDQSESLSDRWPEISAKVERWVDDRAESLEGTPFAFDRKSLTESITDTDKGLKAQIDAVAKFGLQVFHALIVLVLAPIFAFYMLVDLPHLIRVADSLVPKAARPEVVVLSRRMNQAVGGFFRGQLVVALIVGVMASIGLAIIKLPFALLIGMVAGLFNVVPLVGPYIGGIPALIIALTTREPITAAWVLVVMVSVQQIDNHFISPFVMQRAVKLHPVLVMLALLLGGTTGGFFGLLVAVPAAAILKILISHTWRVHVLGEPVDALVEVTAKAASAPGVGMVAEVPSQETDGG